MSKDIQLKTMGGPKVGVYICHCGGNISSEVDVKRLKEEVKTLPFVSVSRDETFMCSDTGQDLIIQDVKEGKVNRVVVASCAPSLHEQTFRKALLRAGLNPYLYEHANIREQVSWVHHGDEATRKAFKLIAAAVAKAKGLKPLEAIRINVTQHATIIGGGIGGLKAALAIAENGLKVTLIESTPFLGGNVARLSRIFPTGEPAHEVLICLAKQVLSNGNIEILTCARVEEARGFVGNFHIKVKRQPLTEEEQSTFPEINETNPLHYMPFKGVYMPMTETLETLEFDTGIIILATGFRPYAPRRGEYGFGEFQGIITLPEMIQSMSSLPSDGDFLEINGKQIKALALIHCVGSRQIPGIHHVPDGERLNEYCSRVCCNATIQLAKEIKERFPGTCVYELYRDIRAYGRGHEEAYKEACERGVIFVRFVPEHPPVVVGSQDGEYGLKVLVKDTLLGGEEIELPVDLVVLSVGMEPNPILALQEDLKLPLGGDGFLLEVHPKLRPVEVSVNGVFLVGTCQAPMDIKETVSCGLAASKKATTLLQRGSVELDPFVAEVELDKCNGCGRCKDACIREGVITMKEMETEGKRYVAMINPALCLGCGVCVPSCPEGAIQVAGWNVDHYRDMVDALIKYDIAVGGDL